MYEYKQFFLMYPDLRESVSGMLFILCAYAFLWYVNSSLYLFVCLHPAQTLFMMNLIALKLSVGMLSNGFLKNRCNSFDRIHLRLPLNKLHMAHPKNEVFLLRCKTHKKDCSLYYVLNILPKCALRDVRKCLSRYLAFR
jgi:hypothetical protein